MGNGDKGRKDFYSEEEAAKVLGISRSTLAKRRGQRKPPAFLKQGPRIWYRVMDILAFVETAKGIRREFDPTAMVEYPPERE
jgi:hypothetical protein